MELKTLQDAQRDEFKTYVRELANDTNNGEESVVRYVLSCTLPVVFSPDCSRLYRSLYGINNFFDIHSDQIYILP